MMLAVSVPASIFLSTPSVGRATENPTTKPTVCLDFYPRPPWGGRRRRPQCPGWSLDFYPRPPWGGRPSWPTGFFPSASFLSTPSVGRATHQQDFYKEVRHISIHALRGEGDRRRFPFQVARSISIHALRGEGDGLCQALHGGFAGFLSTPSVGRATAKVPKKQLHFCIKPYNRFFNIQRNFA